MEQPQVSARASRKANGKPPAPVGPELNLSKLLQALQSVRDGCFGVQISSAIGKTIGGDVQNAQDQGSLAKDQRARTEAQPE